MKPEQAEQILIEQLYQTLSFHKIQESIVGLDKLSGDASTRRYYRLFTNNKSYVVCLDHPSQFSDNSFTTTQRFFKNNGIRVPEIYSKDLSRGYLLEEDLGDQTLLNRLSTVESRAEERKVYQEVLDLLFQVHLCQDTPEIFNQKFDQKKLDEEIDFTLKYYFRELLGEKRESLIQSVKIAFNKINSDIAKYPMVVTHRDFHSRNLMFSDNRFVMIDFQDARLGLPQYDLVSLLEDCYYDLQHENRHYLKRYYYDNFPLIKYGQNTFDEYLNLYNLMAIQRVFKAIGSFSYIYYIRKDIRYLKHISFAMEKIKSFLFMDSSFIQLKKDLFTIYYEN